MNVMDVNCRTEEIYKKKKNSYKFQSWEAITRRPSSRWKNNIEMDLKYTQSRPKDVGRIFGVMPVVALYEYDTDIQGLTKSTELPTWLTTISYLAPICSMKLAYLSKCKRQSIITYTYFAVSVVY